MTAVKLKTYRWYITRGRTLWRQGKKRQALKMWGKAGALKRKLKPKLKRYDFMVTIKYKGKPEKQHDFRAEIIGSAIADKPETIGKMLLDEIFREGEDYAFISVGDIKSISIISEAPTDEKNPRVIDWEIRKFNRL